MLKKIPRIFSILSLSFVLANCTTEQLNTINKLADNLKDVKEVTINVNNVNPQDIEEVQIDNQKLKDYSSASTQFKLPPIKEGKHVVKLKHKIYGEIDLPVEVRNTTENNYQFNPNIVDDKLKDWEIGIDANNDGKIDQNAFYSKEVADYVVVRENSGTTNYLPKQKFEQDYKNHKIYPRPKDFPATEIKEQKTELKQKLEQRSVFLSKPPEYFTQKPPMPPNIDAPFPEKVYIPYPSKLDNYKIYGIVIDDHVLPEEAYKKERDFLIIRADFFRGKNGTFKLYLIDETGQGVLLGIHPKKPIFQIEQRIEKVKARKEIYVNARDLDYVLEKNLKIDIKKFEELKNRAKMSEHLPEPRPAIFPAGRAYESDNFEPVSEENVSENGSKKYVRIDENGDIVDVIDKSNDSDLNINDETENGMSPDMSTQTNEL